MSRVQAAKQWKFHGGSRVSCPQETAVDYAQTKEEEEVMRIFHYEAQVIEDDYMGGLKVEIRVRHREKSYGIAKVLRFNDLLVESLYDYLSRGLIAELKEAFLEGGKSE
jgi:hypothetical protein